MRTRIARHRQIQTRDSGIGATHWQPHASQARASSLTRVPHSGHTFAIGEIILSLPERCKTLISFWGGEAGLSEQGM